VSAPVVARLRIGVLIFVVILVQTTVGADLRVAGVAPDLMVLIAICAGMAGGAEPGAWVGFWSGVVADQFLTSTPVGLSALTFCLVGAAVGALREGVLQARRLLIPAAAFAGTVAAVLMFVAIGDVLGQSQLLDAGRSWLIRVALIEALWSAVLAIPMALLYSRAAKGSVGTERLGANRGGMIRDGMIRTERIAAR
jgi:rod shape-determining protein MreD